MNSISRIFVSLYYRFLFYLKLNKILKNCRDEVVKNFDLNDPQKSYWIDCDGDYAFHPQEIVQQKEIKSAVAQQTEMIMKNWQYFANSRKDFEGLIKYIAWLRSYYANKKQQYVHQNQVSDHIYEL